jgi:mRNA-degrading endonuclease YafQ of YafQ-DinJ toxin-antitoxin module
VLTPRYSTTFKRDVRKAQKRGKDMSKLRVLLLARTGTHSDVFNE